jgi:hypothetical protein
MSQMRNLRSILISIAATIAAHGSDIIKSQEIVADDLGVTKWVPDLKDEKGGWIITCKILDGKEVVDHRSVAYFERTHALSLGWMLMVDPSILGVDYDGRILRFGKKVIKIPGFRDGTVSIWTPKSNRRVLIVESAFANRHKVEYAIENLSIEEIEKICGHKRLEDGREYVEVAVTPPRDTILASELPEWTKKGAAEAGAGQPDTHTESKSEGSDKPQPEAEGRSR